MIEELLREMWLFVCTGNTCRSPMAQGLARKLLAERLGCEVDELICRGFEVTSAGTFAADGGRASAEAVQVAAELGVNIDAHRSQRMTRELIKSADMVFCMSDTHVSEVLRLVPSASPKVCRLDKAVQVSDPIGGGVDACRRSARQIERALRTYLKEEAIL
jgi:protein-tyrosine phosphatase